ncbi:carbohydrate ABC transporter membrane protein 2, CUT1 family [Paenibacillus sp. GP183]|jgi:sn-glycerol 3-phosphate transport system permease protein|nr:carbohydrate ABC transporter permease [Paenibacillus sp. GP183]SEC29285.1 carbohydrate ABC transporter membrane protein 2, CUT1 family [Paenibacillus sp. GP183]
MTMPLSKKIILYAILSICAFTVFFPVIFAILLSFSNNTDIMNGLYIPGRLSFGNYENAFKAQPLMHYIINSVVVSIIMTVLQIVLALLAAYAFVFINFKGKNIIFLFFMATMMIPSEALVISNFQTLRLWNMLNTYSGLILPGLASTFGIFLLRQNFKQIPYELKEASHLAGIGDFRFFRKVAVPMSKNSIVTLAIYNFLVSWNAYMWPLLATTNTTVRTVQIGLRQLATTEVLNDYGMITAGAMIVALPTLILIFAGQSRLQEGLTKGALK